MYENINVDSSFHIPVSSAIKANVEEMEQKTQQVVAPVANPTFANPIPSSAVSAAQTTPVQTVETTSFVPIQYAAKASYDDKMLYKELSAVSDEVLECRNKILNNVY